ncbi:ArdC-like ssDNA-binding domain-containing protein [Helicobacter pylori]|uniref:ArdC family protein n=1 Tax=Helicobacter pylori TaxID=210 RepID=UPI001FD0DC83|nr:ArdC family protein [Helicobacter pylori]UOS13579.1 ArdC-like ssDNA-binding domain-containing protein [Helicobacter pylori]
MKAWNEMDIKEQKEVFARFLASEIAKSLESGLEFKPNNRAYNGNAGNAYNGLNSLILDAKQHENGYESNVWVGLDDALKLGANPKEVEHIKNNTKSKNNPNGFYDKASIAYIRDYEMHYVKARDEQGNFIPVLDKEGNARCNAKGEIIYENEKVPQRDKLGNIKYMQDGKTPFYEFKKEKIDIEPTLEIKNLYNVNVFQTLDKTKLKELDPKTLRTQYISNTFSMDNQNLVIYDLSKHLNESQYKKVLDYVNQYGATHSEKRKQHKIYQEPQQQIAPNADNNAKENNTKEPNNNEMNMAEFSKMLEMAQSNPQMLAMLQQTLNKGAEQQKYDHYFANDEVAPTQSKGRGR